MNKLFLIALMILSVSGCRCNKSCDIPDPCADCKGDYVCIENRCECPPGSVDIGFRCIKEEKGVLKTSLKGTPIACMEDAILEFKPSSSDQIGWSDMTLYYTTQNAGYHAMGGPNFSATYSVGPKADTIKDDFFEVFAFGCDSVSSTGTSARFLGIYYKDLNVFEANFIRWKSHPLVPVDTFTLIFK